MPTPTRNGPASQATFCTVIVDEQDPQRAAVRARAARRAAAGSGRAAGCRRRSGSSSASSVGDAAPVLVGVGAGRATASARHVGLLQLAVLRQQVAVRRAPSASSSRCVPTAAIRPSGQQRHPVGQQHRRRPVRDHQRGRAGEHLAQRLPRPAPRCARPARTAGRPAPAPTAGRAPRGPAPAAAAGRRTATAPARRSGCPGPTAGRARSRPGRPRSASATSSSVASGRPSVRFSRTLTENSVGSSKATATTGAQLGQRQVADVDAVERDPAGGDVVQPGDQRGQRGLARAGGADQRDRLARARCPGRRRRARRGRAPG